MTRKPTVRALRQRIVWRLFDARNRCVLADLKTITDRGPAATAAHERAYNRFTRLAWNLARGIHPARRQRRSSEAK